MPPDVPPLRERKADLLLLVDHFLEKFSNEHHKSIKRISSDVASSQGATTEFELGGDPNPVVVNDAALTARAVASLQRIAGRDNVTVIPFVTGSEDFAYYGKTVPSFFYFVGVTPHGQDALAAPSNHSPKFFVDESALPVALRSLVGTTVDFLQQGVKPD